VAYSGIGYDGTAGTAQGNFDGRRWMVSSGLTGNYQAYGFDIEPSAKVYALWEHENAYTDSLGTQQAGRDFASGRASGGIKLAYPVAWTETIALTPYLGVYGDYYFTQDDAAEIAAAGALPLASTPLLDGWSARLAGGLATRFASGAGVAVGGELGGIGSDVRIWTFRARANVPF
jgi:outer membrane autotransporter protein